jgi:lipopolysaccharide/colanic/teichoic acid biosynthesis glycosyltransferase
MAALKRVTDFTAAILILLPVSPVMLVVAALIKLTSRGPILYWQTRVGRHGQEFQFPKFRSMITNAEKFQGLLRAQSGQQDAIRFKLREDPRVTRVGWFIRKYSIDELPQLWSVLRGDMSLVGPRPALPKEVALYTLADRRRLDVVPGLTCTWQVSGRANIPFPQQVELDAAYIETRSLWLDVRLLVKTIPAVLLARGAY